MIVMEMAVCNLAQYCSRTLSGGSASQRCGIALNILMQLLSGLKYLHREQDKLVLHRDLKLQNVLCFQEDKQLLVKIADFGFAKLLQRGQKTGTTFMGTRFYSDPV